MATIHVVTDLDRVTAADAAYHAWETADAPNPRDFEPPDQWARYDAAMAAWHAEGDRLMAERVAARVAEDGP